MSVLARALMGLEWRGSEADIIFTREPQNNAKSIDRWDNEGGAPSGGDRTARKRPRDTNLQKKAAAQKSPERQAQWPGKPAGA